MRQHLGILIVVVFLLLAGGFVAYRAWMTAGARASTGGDDSSAPRSVAVKVAPIASGTIRDIRTLSGSLEARARFTVAAKVSGLLENITADIGDRVERGQIIAQVDDAEFEQAVAQAEAELAVRKAERSRAESDRTLAQREDDRAQALKERGIASESQLDETAATLQSAEAALKLAEARVQQADASLELAKIRLGYTRVAADWTGGQDAATVAERFQDAGNTVQVGDPIVAVVSLDPLTAVVSVTESDYARLAIDQPATMTTDARPGEQFSARVARIAPIFRESSRQARIEMQVDNPGRVLRPGMFVRVRIVLRESQARAIVPVAALVERGDRQVIFTINSDGETVTVQDVEVGIVQGERAQILRPAISGRVVVLGQQLLEDGSRVTFSDDRDDANLLQAEAGE